MQAPAHTQAEAGRSGLATKEANAVAAFKQQQEMRGAEQSTMTAPQSEMRTKPDCGEASYVGSGKLKDKVALITGGDSGIGRAVAIAFAREGADVAIAYHSHDEDAKDTCRLVEEAGRKCLLLKCEVSDKNQCYDIVERTVKEFGKLDCLVNNAGIQFEEENLEDSFEHLEKIFATNVFSCFWLGGAALKHMREHAGCTLIQNTSINSFKGNTSLISYSATKGAMQNFTRSMATKLASKGIRVNAVAPGPIWSPFISGTFSAEKVTKFGEQTPMERAGQPVECAPAFVFLASSDATFITGATIHVNGGQYVSS